MTRYLWKSMQATLVLIWRHYVVRLCDTQGKTNTISLKSDESHTVLKRGSYLLWFESEGIEALALEDLNLPARRIVWLAETGLNVLLLELKEDWQVARFRSLGSPEGARCTIIHIRRVSWLTGATLAKFAPFDAPNVRFVGIGRYRLFLPWKQNADKSEWHDWASFVHELTILGSEEWVPTALAQRYPPVREPKDQTDQGKRIGVHLHLHYLDVWPELKEDLRVLPCNIHLWVTISENAVSGAGVTPQTIAADLKAEWPNGHSRTVINRGRDIAPLLQLLEEGHFDNVDCVCKIHGKRSFRAGHPTYLGEVWRRHLVGDLLPDETAALAIVQRFQDDAALGMLGPEGVRLPNARISKVIEDDNGLLLGLMRQCFGSSKPEAVTFFAGTMFWFRPQALAAFRVPPQGGWPFPNEPVSEVGSLAHAFERLLPTAVHLAGYRVENLPRHPL